MPSEHAASSSDSSCCTGCASAFSAHPHEQRRPFASSGQMPPSQAQWDPRGGSGTGIPATRASARAAGERTTSVTASTAIAVTIMPVATALKFPSHGLETEARESYHWRARARPFRLKSTARLRDVYSMMTAPAVSPAAGNGVESITSTMSSAPAMTVNATLGRGGAPSPRSSEAMPLKVTRPSNPTEPSLVEPDRALAGLPLQPDRLLRSTGPNFRSFRCGLKHVSMAGQFR